MSVLEYVRQRNKREPDYRYHPNELYDYLTGCLFKERLGQHNRYNIIFSKRGKSNRFDALQKLVETASESMTQEPDSINKPVTYVSAATPKEHAGLQVVNYFVWALQRLYERDEKRYLVYLWDAFRLVHDIDDMRESNNGVCYTQKKPLTAEALRWRK